LGDRVRFIHLFGAVSNIGFGVQGLRVREGVRDVGCLECRVYRGTSSMRSSAPLGPYIRNMPRALRLS